jgi:hypothetical protein
MRRQLVTAVVTLTVTLTGAAILAACGGASGSAAPPAGFRQYKGDHVRFFYPDSWKVSRTTIREGPVTKIVGPPSEGGVVPTIVLAKQPRVTRTSFPAQLAYFRVSEDTQEPRPTIVEDRPTKIAGALEAQYFRIDQLGGDPPSVPVKSVYEDALAPGDVLDVLYVYAPSSDQADQAKLATVVSSLHVG